MVRQTKASCFDLGKSLFCSICSSFHHTAWVSVFLLGSRWVCNLCICASCSIRSIVCLNLPSFSGGLNPWGTPGTRRAADVSFHVFVSVNRTCHICKPWKLVNKSIMAMCRGSSLHLLSTMDLLRLLASVTPGTGWSCWPLMDMALALRRYELLLLPIPPSPDGNLTSQKC